MRGIVAAALMALVTARGHAAAAMPAAPPEELCGTAIAAAERALDLPPHLLAAIGQVESGRRDLQTGRATPWPWTIDADGQGSFLPTKMAAIEAVRALHARGVASIDVGCVQINLMYHPNAFANLQQAFDPRRNAFYGARFLRALFLRTRDWGRAVGLYHSATTTLASDYRRKVMAAWPGATIGATIGATTAAPADPEQALARAWAATLDDRSGNWTKPARAAPSVLVASASAARRQTLPRRLHGSLLAANGRVFGGH